MDFLIFGFNFRRNMVFQVCYLRKMQIVFITQDSLHLDGIITKKLLKSSEFVYLKNDLEQNRKFFETAALKTMTENFATQKRLENGIKY